jgi:cysteinyl-tRNA synthetase
MALRVYNTLTGEKEIFEPVHPGKVGIYLCGPTVYKPPHMGHMVGPVIFDAIKRYLTFKGYQVTWVVNITDVEDKLIAAAIEEKTTVAELAGRYTKDYFDALAGLGIDTIDHFPKASDHIPEIIAMCQALIAKGFAYSSDGNVWFDVTKDSGYGKLSNRRPEDQESGLRELEGSGKHNPMDFGLWKSAKADEPSWDSPWGKGRPGWHIECSAMSMKFLGETFDMHGGGMDLLFPHHENELAQSECCTGKPFARFWMHNGLTKVKTKLASGEVKNEKMSKSIGNVIDAKSLLKQHGPELFRYMLLITHYRRPIDFSDEVLGAAKKGLSAFHRLFERIERLTGPAPAGTALTGMDAFAGELQRNKHESFATSILHFKGRFLEMMDDDFNTAGAIGVLHELAGEINSFLEQANAERDKPADVLKAAVAATHTLGGLGQILGLFRAATAPAPAPPKDDKLAGDLMQLLIKLREDARKSKNFALADAIRKGLTEIGVTLEDRTGGTEWRKV